MFPAASPIPRLPGWGPDDPPVAALRGGRSSGVYCRPECPRAQAADTRDFPSAAAAQTAGLVACDVCAPEPIPGTPDWRAADDLVSRAMVFITEEWNVPDAPSARAGAAADRLAPNGLAADGSAQHSSVPDELARLAERVGSSPAEVIGALDARFGASAAALARAHQANSARLLLVFTGIETASVALMTGYADSAELEHSLWSVYRSSAAQLRGQRSRIATSTLQASSRTGPYLGGHDTAEAAALILRFSARPPFDGPGLMRFFLDHAVLGLERPTHTGFERWTQLRFGRARVAFSLSGESGVLCSARLDDVRDVPELVALTHRLFDLDVDPEQVDVALSADPTLRPLVLALPGIRIPGVFDANEALFRTLLGQQISVPAARTVLGRITMALGTDGLFPTAAQLADGGAGVLRGPAQRVSAILGVAEALNAGDLVLDEALQTAEFVRRLEQVRGIGPWTANYLAMRLLGDPDVLLNTDLIILQSAALRGLPATARTLAAYSERWAPWRSYAGLHLWRARDWAPPVAPPSPATISEYE
ncbi:MAG: DNA-3-methyladenine glycosylase 2 family protein [Glaciihabitans sp.]|nr:DNA-3-methyladenine glycosylase 2 family protein [Glaciihabitans sp.]